MSAATTSSCPFCRTSLGPLLSYSHVPQCYFAAATRAGFPVLCTCQACQGQKARAQSHKEEDIQTATTPSSSSSSSCSSSSCSSCSSSCSSSSSSASSSTNRSLKRRKEEEQQEDTKDRSTSQDNTKKAKKEDEQNRAEGERPEEQEEQKKEDEDEEREFLECYVYHEDLHCHKGRVFGFQAHLIDLALSEYEEDERREREGLPPIQRFKDEKEEEEEGGRLPSLTKAMFDNVFIKPLDDDAAAPNAKKNEVQKAAKDIEAWSKLSLREKLTVEPPSTWLTVKFAAEKPTERVEEEVLPVQTNQTSLEWYDIGEVLKWRWVLSVELLDECHGKRVATIVNDHY